MSGINVALADIDLGESWTNDDKILLSNLVWAPGNLRQTNDNGTGPTIFASPFDYGHFYNWNSEYTGNTNLTGSDPCKSLDAATYGSDWRTPNRDELSALARCTDKKIVTNADGMSGMWMMNSTKGLFLPAAGQGDNSNTVPAAGTSGWIAFYWSDKGWNDSMAFYLSIYNDYAIIHYNKKDLRQFSPLCQT